MRSVVGLDQGATKTVAAVMDEMGAIVGKAAVGGALYLHTGLLGAIDTAMSAVDGALRSAGLSLGGVEAIVAGMTGADWPEEYELLRGALSERTRPVSVRVHNDCMIALAAGTGERPAAVLCVGSGLNVGVLGADGSELVFGYYIDDVYQGAYALARRMQGAVVAAEAGVGPETLLTDAVLSHLGLASVEDLLRKSADPAIRAALTSLVPRLMDLARMGDDAAAGIVRDFAVGAARYVVAGLRRKGLEGRDVPVVFSGSVLKARCRVFQDALRDTIVRSCPKARIIDAVYEPVVGAALLALASAGFGARDAVPAATRRSCERHGLLRIDGAGAYKGF